MAEAFSNVGLLKFLLGLPDLKDWGTVALLDIAKDAEAEFIEEGESLYADECMDRLLYLVTGEIELVSDDQVLQVIKAGSERAKESIFRVHTHGLQARCIKKASLLSLDETTYERYNLSIESKKDFHKASISNYETIDNSDEKVIKDIFDEYYQDEFNLPSMPEVALKINQAIQDENIDLHRITEIVQTDPMISARAVQVANSAMYANNQPVQTIKGAVQRIGLRAMRTIVMSVALRNLYTPKSPLIKKRMQVYYQHSLRVGVICHVLAKSIEGLDPEQAFLAGLIHDIGIVPLLIRADTHDEIKNNAELLDKIIHGLKTKVGAMLLNQWGFEQELITTAAHAEDWKRDIAKADYCDLVQVSQLQCEMMGGIQLDAPIVEEIPAFERLNFDEINPKLIIAQAKKEMGEVIHSLE